MSLLAASWSAAPATAETKELDFSKGSFSGWVWFLWSGEDGPNARATVAIGRLPEARLERVYGLWPGDDGSEVGPIEVEKLSELMPEDGHVLAVKLAPMMFDEVRHLIYRWGHIEEHGSIPPAMIAENLFARVVARIGMKSPYRSALSRSQPISYLTDLSRINR